MRTLFFLLMTTSVAYGHSWYDQSCCSENDCSVILKEREVPAGNEVTTKHGTVVFPKNFPIKPSQDQDEHVCFHPITKTLYCVYRAPKV